LTSTASAASPSAATLQDPLWRSILEPVLAGGCAAGADLVEIFFERTDYIGVLAE